MNSERLEKLKKMLEESPNDPFLNYALAMEYIDEAPLQSWEILSQMLTRFPDYLPTYYQAAQLAAEMELYDQCKLIFEKGISLAHDQNDQKTLHELQAAYKNFMLENG